MTVEQCIEECDEAPDAYSFAALQYSNQCGCSRGFQVGVPAKVTNCNMECLGAPGNGTMCGGAYAVSTYCLGEFKVWCPLSLLSNHSRTSQHQSDNDTSASDSGSQSNNVLSATTANQITAVPPPPHPLLSSLNRTGTNETSLNCYVRLLKPYNFDDAHAQCKAFGGRLPIFNSEDEIANYLYFRQFVLTRYLNDSSWIDLPPVYVNPNATTNRTLGNLTNQTGLAPIGSTASHVTSAAPTSSSPSAATTTTSVEGQTVRFHNVLNLTEDDIYGCLQSNGDNTNVIIENCCDLKMVICQFTESEPRHVFHGDVMKVNAASPSVKSDSKQRSLAQLLLLAALVSETIGATIVSLCRNGASRLTGICFCCSKNGSRDNDDDEVNVAEALQSMSVDEDEC